jgi:hypothetical protein
MSIGGWSCGQLGPIEFRIPRGCDWHVHNFLLKLVATTGAISYLLSLVDCKVVCREVWEECKLPGIALHLTVGRVK